MERTSMVRTSGSTAVVQYAVAPGAFSYVYGIGRIKPFFPSLDIEKEYQQLTPSSWPSGVQTEEQRLQLVLRDNPFLAREMGWVFRVENVNTYVLSPAATTVLEALVKSIVPADPTSVTYDMILGVLDPAASLDRGGDLPGVTLNRTYQFTLTSLAQSVVAALQAQGVNPLPTTAQITELFDDMLQLADNTGDADEHRALNYVSINYPEIYVAPAASSGATVYFDGVETRRSPLGGGRAIIDVILRYINQSNGIVSRYYTSVDVTGLFPFLVTKLQPYFER